MSIKNKIITLLLCVFGALAIVEYTVQHFVLLPAFVQLERTAAIKNTERALQALDREVELLIPSATDWATWDDTYLFMVDRNAEYIESNLNLKAMESLNVNLLEFYSPDGTRLWGEAYDFETEKELKLGELSKDRLGPGSLLLGNSGKEDTVAGLYPTSEGVFLVASRPILTSKGEGPSRGRVVIGRLLNEAAIDRIGTQARVQLRVETLKPTEDHASAPIHDNRRGHTPIEITEGDTITQTTTDLLDIAGAPILRFHVETPRTIVDQGRSTLKYASLSLAIAGLLVLLVLLIFLRYTIFIPVSLLIRHAIAVGTHDDLSTRLQMKRNDEIGTLAKEFDIMVQRLSETRQRLLEQSFKSGIAEMASGVLHNIGNAITPLNIRLATLQQDLRAAPLAEMELAAAELADSSTPPDRRVDLVQFVELAGSEMASLIKVCQEKVEASIKQVGQVQEILSDQQRFSRSVRVIEAVDMVAVIKDVEAGLSPETRDMLNIEITPGVAEIGTVAGSRAALHQVVANLLINAAESIQSAGSAIGRVIVTAEHENLHGQSMVGLRFADNGGGIDPDHLGRLFERGFSTKNREGSGYGLHWSANTVQALGGQLSAESAGVGSGACMHMLLPPAGNPAQKTTEPDKEHDGYRN